MTFTRILVFGGLMATAFASLFAVRHEGESVATRLAQFYVSEEGQYYVSPEGDDQNPGTFEAPFKSWARAEQAAQPGDLVYFRGGYYRPEKRVHLTKSGLEGKRIRYKAYPHETPVFDLSLIDSEVGGVEVNADWLHIANMEFANGRRVCIRLTVRNGIDGSASHNILEQLDVHDCGNAGVTLWGNDRGDGSVQENLLLNVDSYRHYHPPDHGNQGDGIVVGGGVGPGNQVKGCRVWDNADDGFDTWSAGSPVTFQGNWSMRNGFNLWGQQSPWEGGGHGFKLGRSVAKDNHVLLNNVSVGNARWGFNDNKNRASLTLINNTAYGNGLGQFRLNHGQHIARYNLAPQEGVSLSEHVVEEMNSWNYSGLAVSLEDFVSVDIGYARYQRDPLGRLPTLGFFRLREDSEIRAISEGDVNLGFEATNFSLEKQAVVVASRQ